MNVIVTIAIGDLDYAKYTLPSMERYAKKIGCDFKIINERKYPDWNSPKWEIFQTADFLDKYDRVLYLDADILVTDHAENVFDFVDSDKLGCVLEESGRVYSGAQHRYEGHILDYFYIHNGIDKDRINRNAIDYFNSGVLVLSQCHKNLFEDKSKKTCDFFNQYHEHLQDQTYLNYHVETKNILTDYISRKFNFLVRYKNMCKWIPPNYPMVTDNIVKQNNVAFMHFVGPVKIPRIKSYFSTKDWTTNNDKQHIMEEIKSERYKYI